MHPLRVRTCHRLVSMVTYGHLPVFEAYDLGTEKQPADF